MYEKKGYFFSVKKGKNIEFTISHEVVDIFGSPNNRFKVECPESDDFSEFYDKLIAKEPLIRNGQVSKTTNSIGLYSKDYLASVMELLTPMFSSQEGLNPQNFQPVFTPAQNTQPHLDSVSSAAKSNADQLQPGPTMN